MIRSIRGIRDGRPKLGSDQSRAVAGARREVQRRAEVARISEKSANRKPRTSDRIVHGSMIGVRSSETSLAV